MKLSLRQIRTFIFIVILAVSVGGIGYWLGTHRVKIEKEKLLRVRFEKAVPDEREIDLSLFWTVWDKLDASYLDKDRLDQQKRFYGAIKGMVAALDDPYTVFLPPTENKEVKEDLNGSFEGVGIQLGYEKNQLAVIAPLKGTPAEKAGIKSGDLILKIDGRETGGMSLPEAVRLIRGPQGTVVKLTLLHQGETESYEATLVREKIIIPSVVLEWREKEKIAHLRLLRFGDRTMEEWHKAVEEIVSRQLPVKGIILDLRNNPGGYLSGSVFIASEFLNSGVVVQQESSRGVKETFSVNRTGKLTSQKLVVLINKGSASASEIVAGALRIHQRAVLVGEKSFGKGTIQEAEDLSGGAGLHITTARWLLPDGKSIDQQGVAPDYEVKDDSQTEIDEQLEKASEIILKF